MMSMYDHLYSIELSGLSRLDSVPDEFCIAVNAQTIQKDLRRAQDENERQRLQTCWSSMINYVKWRRGTQEPEFEQKMNELSDLVKEFTISKFRPRVPTLLPGQSLRSVLSDIIAEREFNVLGPEQQKVGLAVGGCRFVCIFCHEVKVKTGDLRVHLVKKHGCDWDEVKQIFHRSNPEGLRVFGQYSYDDVCANKWDIKDWTQRKQRSEGTADVKRKKETVRGSTQKRRQNSECPLAFNQLPLSKTQQVTEQSDRLPGLTQATTTRSPTSPETQTMPVDQNGIPNFFDTEIDSCSMEEFPSMEDSTGDLVGVGVELSMSDGQYSEAMYSSGPSKSANVQILPMFATIPDCTTHEHIDPRLLSRASPSALNSVPSFDAMDMLLGGSMQQLDQHQKT